jgi:hypothetical protein
MKHLFFYKERRAILKRIVILKGSIMDSLEKYVLSECLNIMFPACGTEIRSHPSEYGPEEEIPVELGQNQLSS